MKSRSLVPEVRLLHPILTDDYGLRFGETGIHPRFFTLTGSCKLVKGHGLIKQAQNYYWFMKL